LIFLNLRKLATELCVPPVARVAGFELFFQLSRSLSPFASGYHSDRVLRTLYLRAQGKRIDFVLSLRQQANRVLAAGERSEPAGRGG
jgi:hypothetical protein